MDRIIEIKVNGSHLTKDSNVAGVQHEANARTLRITFDEGWDGYAKKVTFWDALKQNPVRIILGADRLENLTESTRVYLCPIPGEAMNEAGWCSFVIDGYVDGRRHRSLEDRLKVFPADHAEESGEPADPTPSQAEQLQVQIDTILEDMQGWAVRAEDGAKAAEGFAKQAQTAAGSAQGAAASAAADAERARQVSLYPPRIGDNGNWLVWNAPEGYIDSGVRAVGTVGSDGADGASTFYTASSGTESKYLDIMFSQDEVETAGREIQQGDIIISADGTVWSVDAFVYEALWAGGRVYADCSRLASLVGPAGAVPEGWEDRLGTLETQMSNLLYNPITISTFGHNAGTREMGDTVTALTLSWSTNKAPTALALNGEAIDPELTSMALSDLDITGNRTWTLQATDERGAKTVKNTTVSFYNGIYYGGAAQPEIIDSAFIMGLSKKELSGTKNRTISITGGDGLYVWYAYPKRLGTSLFNIGGFDYEYELTTVSFTNKFGYTEDYYVYRSGQYAPASLSVTVKNGG